MVSYEDMTMAQRKEVEETCTNEAVIMKDLR